MKQSATPLNLATLRSNFGTFEKNAVQGDGFVQTGLKRKRKVYDGNARQGRWVYRPSVLSDDLPRLSQIPREVNENSALGIQCNAELAIMQLVDRSRAGDKEALRSLMLTISNAIQELSRLAPEQPENVKALAETVPYWPLRMSLNPKDIERSRGYCPDDLFFYNFCILILSAIAL